MKMYPSCIIGVFLGLVLGVWTQVPDPFPTLSRPPCDSPEVEEAALVAQDYLNAQHTHGYKYALNQIEEIKIISRPGEDTYFLEVELLETNCHVLDPTPVANCTVRPKVLTAIEGDCDVVLKKVQGALTVTAFKCKTEESTEDLCLGCPTLLLLNDTSALEFVHASLATLNFTVESASFTLLEVGRMSSQVVSGKPIYFTEFVIAKANCTGKDCVPLTDATAQRGLCHARGLTSEPTVDCNMFVPLAAPVDANSTAPLTGPVLPPAVHVHRGNLTRHGLRHHQLTATHNPQFLSSESSESQEVVSVVSPAVPTPVVRATDAPATAPPATAPPAANAPAAQPDAPVHVAHETSPAEGGAVPDADTGVWSAELPVLYLKKREAPNAEAAAAAAPAVGVPAVQLCPGRKRFF